MSAIYNLRTSPSGFTVTKFNDDFNVESCYEMTISDGQLRCGCPAGARPTCRHRQMFAQLRTRVDSAWFLDFDTREWVDPTGDAALSKTEPISNEGPQGSLGLGHTDLMISPEAINEALESSPEPQPIITQADAHPFRRRM